MAAKVERSLARLGKGVYLIVVLFSVFSAVRQFGHNVLEVGIIYQGFFLVQYDLGEECVLNATAFLAALALFLFYVMVREKRVARTIYKAR